MQNEEKVPMITGVLFFLFLPVPAGVSGSLIEHPAFHEREAFPFFPQKTVASFSPLTVFHEQFKRFELAHAAALADDPCMVLDRFPEPGVLLDC